MIPGDPQSSRPGAREWLEIDVLLPESAVVPGSREAVIDILVAHGAPAVEERGGSLRTHVRWPKEPTVWMDALTRSVERVIGRPVNLTWRPRDHAAWEDLWKQGLAARRIGRRFVVKPTWVEYAARPDDLIVEIDPGMAFGTAEHATTRGCLRLLEWAVGNGDRVLDIGTGSAILAVGAVRLGAGFCVAIDADPLALEAARANLVRNGVADRVELRLEEVGIDHAFSRSFDGVVANVVSGVLFPRLGAVTRALASDGWMVIGGIESAERDAALRTTDGVGLRLRREDTEDGWWSAHLVKAEVAATRATPVTQG